MQLNNVFFKKCITLIMVIRFTPNKNNHKVVEEQAVWWGTGCYAKISHQFESFSNLHGSAVP